MSQTPRLEEVIEHAVGNRLESFPTALPAKVLSFDSTGSTCNLEVQVTNAFEDSEGTKHHLWAKAVNIPVVFQGSGTNRITVPIKEGDMVLYIIASLPLYTWLKNNGARVGYNLPHESLNSISSGFAIPGVFTPNKVPNSAPTDAIVIHGPTKLGGTSGNGVANLTTLNEFMTVLADAAASDTSGALGVLHTYLVTAGWPASFVSATVESV